MQFDILTIFPDYFGGPLGCGLLGKAIAAGKVTVAVHDLRGWADGPHRQVDDTPYGGGPGMVMKPEPIWKAIDAVRQDGGTRPLVVLLSPQGDVFDHRRARAYLDSGRLLLICGRYEGVDHRIAEHVVDETLSIGDYVLAGGEAAALVVIEAVARLLPGVVGNPASVDEESFATGLLDYPQYTRPPEFRGWRVPDTLLSGDHAQIDAWRRAQAKALTQRKRPDLLERIRG